MKYVYPELSNRDFGFFRIGGPGLANCMFFAARACLRAKREGLELLRPTWERIGIGQWLRREKDKRFYQGLFRSDNILRTLRKAWLIHFSHEVVVESGLKGYFADLIDSHQEVRQYLDSIILPEAISLVPENLSRKIAVHIRLGDYMPPYITPVDWYAKVILSMQAKIARPLEFLVFSDGTDEQLRPVLSLPGVQRAFYGNALADIIAISRCGFLIGSDSTFSGWGAYLGQVASVFPHLHYSAGGGMLTDPQRIRILTNRTDFPDEMVRFVPGR